MTASTARRYDAYQASGMNWLDKIPAHWDIDRAKSLFRKMLRPISESDDIITVFRDGQVTLRKNRRTSGFTNSIKEVGYQGIRRGDLVIHAMDAFAGAIGVSDSDGKGTPVYSAYTPVDPTRVHVPYYGLLVRQMALSGFVSSLGKGIRERSSEFRHKEFAPLELPVPPYDEQQAIVDYLDAKTAQIDRKIGLLTQKTAKYHQLKQSLINEVVTRGLGKSVPMKDSGIGWIGEVPAHWEMRRVSDVVKKIGNGVTPRGGSTMYTDTGIPFLRSQNVHDDGLRLADVSYVPLSIHEEMRSSQLMPYDILFNITGASISRTCIVPPDLPPANINQHVAFLRVARTVDVSFVALFLKSPLIKNYVRFEQNGASKEAFTLKQIADIPLVLPPWNEQRRIVEHLEAQTDQIDRIVCSTEAQIDKLKELRKALINDVVTGKLRVA